VATKSVLRKHCTQSPDGKQSFCNKVSHRLVVVDDDDVDVVVNDVDDVVVDDDDVVVDMEVLLSVVFMDMLFRCSCCS
jgi:hypothetical protein